MKKNGTSEWIFSWHNGDFCFITMKQVEFGTSPGPKNCDDCHVSASFWG
jgi:hypothetical protein